MPQQLGAPGVYIEEIPSGRRVIKSVSTNIAAFIDFFREGPMNEAVPIFGTADFDRIFGGYDKRSEASYAIPQFFLNGGTQAFVVRVASTDPADAQAAAASATLLGLDGATAVLEVAAASEGVWGNNLRLDVDHNVTAPAAVPPRFNLTVRRYQSTAGNAQVVASESYLELSLDENDARYAPTVINEESRLIAVTHVDPADTTTLPAPSGTTGGDLVLNQAALDALSAQTFDVAILDAGGAATVTETATLETWAANDVTTLEQLRVRVERAIRRADATNPSFANARVTLSQGRLRVLSGRGGAAYAPLERFQFSTPTADTLMLSNANAELENVQEYLLGAVNGGTTLAALDPGDDGNDGVNAGPTDIIGTAAVEPPTGMFALERVDLFNILCIPAAADLDDAEMDAVISNALSYCADRRAFMVVDIPATINETMEMKAWLEGNNQYRSQNAAVYFPRVRVPDPLDEFRLRSLGASGTMAGIYARTDTQRGVWKAPAGIETVLEGVSELDAPLTDALNGILNPLGINCLRSFPVYGSISWGARTLRGADALASEWAYIPVRRTALMLEESLFRGTKWVVFEPNTETTWANIRLNIGAFMNGLFRQGAFAGQSPKEAYYVKCDSETTTQNDIDQGIVNIEVGFAPLKPAEFVVIKFRQIVGEVEV